MQTWQVKYNPMWLKFFLKVQNSVELFSYEKTESYLNNTAKFLSIFEEVSICSNIKKHFFALYHILKHFLHLEGNWILNCHVTIPAFIRNWVKKISCQHLYI
jgi:hypothetical protein